MPRRSRCVVMLLLCSLLPALLQAQSATLVLHNAKVLTVDASFSIRQAIAIAGDRILAVGDDAAILAAAGPDTRRIDLEGQTVIPGLIDNHAHIMRSAAHWPGEVRLDGVASREQALRRIAAKARQLAPGEWIHSVGGFSPTQFRDDATALRIAELDRAAPHNPVLLQHLFGMAYVNTRAFEAIGIDADTDIEWLEIANDIDLDDTARPTGVVRGAAMRRMQQKFTPPSHVQHVERARELNRYLNGLGLTAVLDATGGVSGNPDLEAYRTLDQRGELTLRVFHLFPAPDYRPDEVGKFAAELQDIAFFEQSDYLQRIGVGERLYGPIHDSMAVPAADSAEHRTAFAELARQTAEAGLHLHQHATHIQSIRQHLDTFEQLAAHHDLARLRWTFTHADGIDDAAIERAKSLGMMLATQSRRLIAGDAFSHPLPLIAFGDPPLRSMQASGIRWGLGTDTMTVAQANPFLTLWWAVTGKAINGEQLAQQTVDRRQALIAHTRENAWFLFRERDLGSLEPGKFADLVVLDRDYLGVPEDEIAEIRPVMTLVGGEVVYRRP